MATHTQKLQRYTMMLAALLASLLAGIALIVWSDRKSHSTSQYADNTFSHLRIQRPQQADIVMNKLSDDSWTMKLPCSVSVNAQRLTPLLNALRPAAHSYSAAEVDLEAAGLLQPKATLMLDETRVLIGNADLQGERRYIQRGDRVEFAPEWIQSLIDGGVTAFSQLSVFTFDFDQISATQLDGRTVSITDTSVANWQGISAQQIVPWPVEGSGESTATIQLDFTGTNGKQSAELHRFERFDAVKFSDAQCAYILPGDTLPLVVTD